MDGGKQGFTVAQRNMEVKIFHNMEYLYHPVEDILCPHSLYVLTELTRYLQIGHIMSSTVRPDGDEQLPAYWTYYFLNCCS